MRHLALIAATLIAVGACKREGSDQAPPAAATIPSAEQVAPASVSPPTATPAARQAPTGARPDSLIAAIPAADALVALDLAALSAWTSAGLDPDSPPTDLANNAINDLLATVDPAARIELAPESRAVAWAWTPRGVTVASDQPPTAAGGTSSSPAADLHLVSFGTPPTGDPATFDSPPTALFSASVSDLAALPPALAESLDFLPPLGVTRFTVAAEGDGSLHLHAHTPTPQRVIEALGRGQIFVSQALGQLNGEVPPHVQPWISYANRVTQAAFSRVSVTADEGQARLSVPTPACGGPFRNAFLAAMVLTFADMASADPASAAVPYVAMNAPIADGCSPIAGPPPTIPASAAHFGAQRGDAHGTLLVLDLAATLRAGLPSLFGTLPFALPEETIQQVFGGRPMGLTSLTDPASVVFARERTSPTSPPQQALILPSSMLPFVAGSEPIDTMAPFVTPTLVGYSTPTFDPGARAASSPAEPWISAIASAPPGTLAVLALNATTTAALAARLPANDPVRDLLNATDAVVFAARPSGLSVGLIGVPPGVDAAQLRQDLPPALASLRGPLGTSAFASESASVVARALQFATVRTEGNNAWVDLSGGAVPVIGAVIRVGLPLFAGISGRGHIGVPVQPGTSPGVQRSVPLQAP